MNELTKSQWKSIKLLFSKEIFTDREFSFIARNLTPVTMRVKYHDRRYYIVCRGAPKLKGVGLLIISVGKKKAAIHHTTWFYNPENQTCKPMTGPISELSNIAVHKKASKSYKGVEGIMRRSKLFRSAANKLSAWLLLGEM